MAKKRKLQPLSDFEMDGIWMSYRYCIGRKTIASNMRAGDILQNCYERLKLNPSRMEFMCYDIGRSIEDCLRWGQLNVYFNSYNQDDHIYPLDEVIKAITDKDGYLDEDSLNNITKININVYSHGNVGYDIKRGECDNKHYPLNDILDLLVWQDCAKMLDISQHKMCKCYYNDKDEYIEYVDLFNHIMEDGKHRFVIRKVPVHKYTKNNLCYSYINENYIVEDNLAVDEKLIEDNNNN